MVMSRSLLGLSRWSDAANIPWRSYCYPCHHHYNEHVDYDSQHERINHGCQSKETHTNNFVHKVYEMNTISVLIISKIFTHFQNCAWSS